MRKARILSQILFLLLFAGLFIAAQYQVNSSFPSDIFFKTSPLIAIFVSLAARTLVAGFVVVSLIILLTVLFGRVYCGWICPLGTVIDISGKFVKKSNSAATGPNSLRFFLLFFIFLSAVFSFQMVWLFDPIVLLYRTSTLLLHPLFKWSADVLFAELLGNETLYELVYPLYDKLQIVLIGNDQLTLLPVLFAAALFFTILLLEKKTPRYWCRYVCPLGGLLGLLSGGRLLKRQVSNDCKNCVICVNDCKMNALDTGQDDSKPMDCILCGNCVQSCPRHSVRYVLKTGYRAPAFDKSRRGFVWAGVGSVAALGLSKVVVPRRQKEAIRPPGALVEKEFLDHCIRCQACVRICSSTGACLQPMWVERGLEAMMSPAVMPAFGYCEFNCNLCGEVCPTGAIQPLDLDVKKTTKIGLAYFDKNRCIPYAEARDCLVCEEHCPTPDKAIKIEEKAVELPNGREKMVKIPYIVKELCIGCGICENKCPVKGSPGIIVTNEGENRLTLQS